MKGFSLIELLVSISIIALLVYGAVSNYDRYNTRQRLMQTAKNLINDLRFFQNKAISGVKPAGCTQLVGYQVSFPTASSYASQADCFPEGLVGAVSTVNLANGITFSPAPSPILFSVLTRGISNNVTIALINASASISYAISVSASGDINDLGFQ